MPTADTLRQVDAFWAAYFGCTAEDLNAARTLAVPHAALANYDGALVFRHGPACVVSVPEMTPEVERVKFRQAKPEEVFDPKFLGRTFVVGTDKVTGPAWVGLADRSDYRSVPTSARLLGEADEGALARLAEGCGEAWKQSKLVVDLKPLFGHFEGREIVAVSGYRVMGNLLAYVGVITHPDHRGKGHAKSVVARAMDDAFSNALVAMWRTPEANAGAVKLAQSLGFKLYARTYDVQLTEDEF